MFHETQPMGSIQEIMHGWNGKLLESNTTAFNVCQLIYFDSAQVAAQVRR